VADAIRRFPSGVFAIWYPLTSRARIDEFLRAIRALNPPSALAVELTIAGELSNVKMKGCGLLVINPPWRFDEEALPVVLYLARALAQEPGGSGRVDWLVPEQHTK
jgi:23S rRNA (adenine2030-N6)-methyltransferase